jgi:hypothetical protein
VLVPGNSGLPVAISKLLLKGLHTNQPANIQPADQISIGVEYFRDPIKTSGALYHSVTTLKGLGILKIEHVPHVNNFAQVYQTLWPIQNRQALIHLS